MSLLEQVRTKGRLPLPETRPTPKHFLLPAPALQRAEAGQVLGQGEDDHLQPLQAGRLLQGTWVTSWVLEKAGARYRAVLLLIS